MTCYDLPQIQRVRFAVATQEQFGTDLTTDVATNFHDLRIVGGADPMTAAEFLPDETIAQRAFQRLADVKGPERASMEVASYWCGNGTVANATTTPTKRQQQRFLEALLGGYRATQGGTITGSETAISAALSAGHGARFVEGQTVVATVGGVPYLRYVTDITGEVVSWWPALPAATDGTVLYGTETVFPTDCPESSIQILWEAAKQRANIWLLMGGQGSLSLDVSRGQLAGWSSALSFAKYKHDDDIATPQGGSAIAAATIDGGGPIHVSGSGLHFGPNGVTTLAPIRDAGLTFELSREWIDVSDMNGLEGLGFHRSNTRTRMTATISLPFEDETYYDAMDAGTRYGLLLQLGGTLGEVRGIVLPSVQIIGVAPAEANGLRGQSVEVLIHESTLGDLTTEIGRAPFVLGHG